MGLLIAAFILYLLRSVRGRLAKDGSRLKFALFGASDKSNLKDHENARAAKLADTQWADGLRGLASIGVVSSHVCLSFWRGCVTPTAGGAGGSPHLFQRPFFRLVIQGQSFVAIFFILLGFVNSLKPLKQAQKGLTEEALLALSRSALNRSARLALPATVVTCIAWLLSQLHLNEVARDSDAFWLQTTSVKPLNNFGTALKALEYSLVNTWVWGVNAYDQPQWALKWLLIGSFWVFIILLMTITTQPRFRLLVFFCAYVYAWTAADFILGTNLYFGIFLAQLHVLLSSHASPSSSHPATRLNSNLFLRCIPILTAVLGLYLMSYPADFAADAPWSRSLMHLAAKIAPSYSDVPKVWAGIGAQILTLSIYFSLPLQWILTRRIPLYLGGVSFSIYLLHGPLMRSVLALMTFGPSAVRNEWILSDDGRHRYAIPSNAWLALVLPIWCMILMVCVHLWSVEMEPRFAKASKALEEFATGRRSKNGGHTSPLALSADSKQKVMAQFE